MTPPSIVLLSSHGNPLLGILITELGSQGIPVSAVVFDGQLSDRDRSIQMERTHGFFDWSKVNESTEGIRTHEVRDHNGAECIHVLQGCAPDIIVNAGTPRILKAAVLAVPRYGVINTHPGLLPQYRGCTAVEWALYDDEPVGATCHFMTEGIDEGPLIYSEVMPIQKGDTYEAVRTNMIYHWARVMAKGIEKVQNGSTIDTLLPQGEGTYYDVIPPDKLAVVKDKMVKGTYKCYTI